MTPRPRRRSAVREGMNKGHLIAHSLDGAPKDRANFVPLLREANYPEMYFGYEKMVKDRVENTANPQGVMYQVIPVYTVYKYIPCQLIIVIKGSKDGFLPTLPLVNEGTINGEARSGCRV